MLDVNFKALRRKSSICSLAEASINRICSEVSDKVKVELSYLKL